jgi:hypothetical protein
MTSPTSGKAAVFSKTFKEATMQPLAELALRGLALMLAPVAFAGVLAIALASLPAATPRGFLSR